MAKKRKTKRVSRSYYYKQTGGDTGGGDDTGGGGTDTVNPFNPNIGDIGPVVNTKDKIK